MLVLFQLCVLCKSIFQELLCVFSYSSDIVLLKLKDFLCLQYLKFLAVFQLNLGHFNWLWMQISRRTRETHTYYRAFGGGAVTTCFNSFGLPRLGFEHATFLFVRPMTFSPFIGRLANFITGFIDISLALNR